MKKKVKTIIFLLLLIGILMNSLVPCFSNNLYSSSYIESYQPSIMERFNIPSKSLKRDYWPTKKWLNSTPENQGMNSEKLNQMIRRIETDFSDMHSIILIRNGYIVLEKYFDPLYTPESRHTLQSVTKSFTSTLIGIAIREGFIENVNQKVIDFFPGWTIANLDSRKKAMTIEHLLTMTTGFDWDEWSLPHYNANNSLNKMHNSDDAVQHVLHTPMAYNPGDVWNYNSGASILLGAIIKQASGYSPRTFAKKYLFEPLGISNTLWWPAPGGWDHTGGGLYLRPRDMVKLGFLFLNYGTWNGKQIVSVNWVNRATQTINYPFENDDYYGYGYGYQWWTIPNLGIFCARGADGQYILVSPDYDLVIGFNADFTSGPDPANLLIERYILPALTTEPSTDESADNRDYILILILVILSCTIPAIFIGVYLITRKIRRK